MLRRVNLVVLLGLIVGAVFVFGLTAGAQTGEGAVGPAEDVGAAQDDLARIREDAEAAGAGRSSAFYQLENLSTEIAATNKDLVVSEKDHAQAKARLEKRASQMYKSGNVGFVDVLVGTKDFSEFASRLEIWVKLLVQERAALDEARETRDVLAARKKNLEIKRDQREAAITEAEMQQDRLAELEVEMQDYRASLDKDLQAQLEDEQVRQVEAARATGEKMRAEFLKVASTEASPVPTEARAEGAPVEAAPAADTPKEIAPVEAAPAADTPKEIAPVEAAPAADTLKEVAPATAVPVQPRNRVQKDKTADVALVAGIAPVEEVSEKNLTDKREKRAEARRQARIAAEQAAADRAAAEQIAAEQAVAAEEASRRVALAAERDTAEQAAVEQQAAEQAAREAKQAAAEAAQAEQAEAERYAAEQQQLVAAQEAAAQEAPTGGTVNANDADQYGANGPVATEQYGDDAPQDQYDDGNSQSIVSPAAGSAPQPTVQQPAAQQPAAQQPAAQQPAAPSAGPVSGDAVVAEALNWMGTPYLYGGNTRAGISCTGLTQVAYGKFGVSLPITEAGQLAAVGGTLNGGPAPVGAIVFFSEDGSGNVTHLGLSTGDGSMVHASTYAGMVTVTPIQYVDGYLGWGFPV